jgi:hypothetical protein
MGKQMIQGFWRGEHLVRREQQQAIKPTCEGDGLGWANSNMNILPFLLLNPFLAIAARFGLISTPTTSPSGPTAWARKGNSLLFRIRHRGLGSQALSRDVSPRLLVEAREGGQKIRITGK